MSEFKFNCPHCDQHLKADGGFSGRQIQCPNCDHLIRIPPAPGQIADYKPESRHDPGHARQRGPCAAAR